MAVGRLQPSAPSKFTSHGLNNKCLKATENSENTKGCIKSIEEFAVFSRLSPLRTRSFQNEGFTLLAVTDTMLIVGFEPVYSRLIHS